MSKRAGGSENGEGGVGGAKKTRTLQRMGAPVLLARDETSLTISIALTASGYKIQFREMDGLEWRSLISNDPGYVFKVAVVRKRNLIAGQSYVFRIKPDNDDGDWSLQSAPMTPGAAMAAAAATTTARDDGDNWTTTTPRGELVAATLNVPDMAKMLQHWSRTSGQSVKASMELFLERHSIDILALQELQVYAGGGAKEDARKSLWSHFSNNRGIGSVGMPGALTELKNLNSHDFYLASNPHTVTSTAVCAFLVRKTLGKISISTNLSGFTQPWTEHELFCSSGRYIELTVKGVIFINLYNFACFSANLENRRKNEMYRGKFTTALRRRVASLVSSGTRFVCMGDFNSSGLLSNLAGLQDCIKINPTVSGRYSWFETEQSRAGLTRVYPCDWIFASSKLVVVPPPANGKRMYGCSPGCSIPCLNQKCARRAATASIQATFPFETTPLIVYLSQNDSDHIMLKCSLRI